jgi:hypothetical protein
MQRQLMKFAVKKGMRKDETDRQKVISSSYEFDAKNRWIAPFHAAFPWRAAVIEHERELGRDAENALDLKLGAVLRNVANRAGKRGPTFIEGDSPAFERLSPHRFPLLGHGKSRLALATYRLASFGLAGRKPISVRP